MPVDDLGEVIFPHLAERLGEAVDDPTPVATAREPVGTEQTAV